MSINPLYLNAFTLTTALGRGNEAQLSALHAGKSNLRTCHFPGAEDLLGWVGQVDGVDDVELSIELANFTCRNNCLAALGLAQDGFEQSIAEAVERYGADRIGVFIGTSTSGIQAAELAYASMGNESRLPDFHYAFTHNNFSIASYVQQHCHLTGPACSVSTACSSSAKVFAQAHRYIQTGLCDAALVGGVDTLCLTSLYGFNSLQLIAPQPCRPFDTQRNGISIGEAAGFALLEKNTSKRMAPVLMGFGESSDAYHISSPHPEGIGAQLAMRQALLNAGLSPRQVDYVHLHGTGTIANDRAEDCAVFEVFGGNTACSSTKAWTGHTLGAAGIVGAIFTALSLQHALAPQSLNMEVRDPQMRARLLSEKRIQPMRYGLTNALGFGGTNCSLVLGLG